MTDRKALLEIEQASVWGRNLIPSLHSLITAAQTLALNKLTGTRWQISQTVSQSVVHFYMSMVATLLSPQQLLLWLVQANTYTLLSTTLSSLQIQSGCVIRYFIMHIENLGDFNSKTRYFRVYRCDLYICLWIVRLLLIWQLKLFSRAKLKATSSVFRYFSLYSLSKK